MSTNDQDTPAPENRSSDAGTMTSAAEGLAEDAKSKARDAGEAIVDKARERADTAKDNVAEEISSVSSALRRASDDLRDGSPQERTFAAAADALADVADTVRGKDLGEMADHLSDFARRNPLAFLGGAALLGFAGARMAKASQRARASGGRPDEMHSASGHGGGSLPHGMDPSASRRSASAPSRSAAGGHGQAYTHAGDAS